MGGMLQSGYRAAVARRVLDTGVKGDLTVGVQVAGATDAVVVKLRLWYPAPTPPASSTFPPLESTANAASFAVTPKSQV